MSLLAGSWGNSTQQSGSLSMRPEEKGRKPAHPSWLSHARPEEPRAEERVAEWGGACQTESPRAKT